MAANANKGDTGCRSCGATPPDSDAELATAGATICQPKGDGVICTPHGLAAELGSAEASSSRPRGSWMRCAPHADAVAVAGKRRGTLLRGTSDAGEAQPPRSRGSGVPCIPHELATEAGVPLLVTPSSQGMATSADPVSTASLLDLDAVGTSSPSGRVARRGTCANGSGAAHVPSAAQQEDPRAAMPEEVKRPRVSQNGLKWV